MNEWGNEYFKKRELENKYFVIEISLILDNYFYIKYIKNNMRMLIFLCLKNIGILFGVI